MRKPWPHTQVHQVERKFPEDSENPTKPSLGFQYLRGSLSADGPWEVELYVRKACTRSGV